jgi:hypothetical protein
MDGMDDVNGLDPVRAAGRHSAYAQAVARAHAAVTAARRAEAEEAAPDIAATVERLAGESAARAVVLAEAEYQHAEAFCVMTYRSDDGTEDEEVWNSRDGVTPFVITLRSGKQATHVNWRSDVHRPDFIPPPGSRVFIDMTDSRAREITAANCASWWNDGGATGMLARGRFRTLEQMIAELSREMQQPGQPDLVEVPPEGWTP